MPVILELGKLAQKNLKFEARPYTYTYIVKTMPQNRTKAEAATPLLTGTKFPTEPDNMHCSELPLSRDCMLKCWWLSCAQASPLSGGFCLAAGATCQLCLWPSHYCLS
jgi:hypothetical protein